MGSERELFYADWHVLVTFQYRHRYCGIPMPHWMMSALRVWYWCWPFMALNRRNRVTACYSMFCNMAASSLSRPKPHKQLPPTDSSARFHIMRSHLQAVTWVTLQPAALNASEWGWKTVDNELLPITSDSPPAPDDLLAVIRCKWRTATRSTVCLWKECITW